MTLIELIFSDEGLAVALKKCKECQTLLPERAAACPLCGAKVRRTSRLTWTVLICIVIVAINALSNSKPVESTSHAPASATHSPPDVPDLPRTEKKNVAESNWSESSYTDDMTDEVVKVYNIRSKSSVSFGFPYNQSGGSYLSLHLRKGSKSPDAYFKIDKGQMICGYSDCGFLMRVNGGKPQRWTGLNSSTGNADLMFIRDAKAIEEIVMAGGTIRIGIDFYQAGQQAFDFDLAGYPGK